MSIRDNWETPPALFDVLNREFDFTIDVAATEENRKCGFYLSESTDAIAISAVWRVIHHSNQVSMAWCNPPYSRIGAFVDKAISELFWDRQSVLLLPNDCSTKWFDLCVKHCQEIRFLTGGRVQFNPPAGVKPSSNTGSSILAIFKRRPVTQGTAVLTAWNWKEAINIERECDKVVAARRAAV